MAATWIGTNVNGDSIYRLDDGSYAFGSDAKGWTYTSTEPPMQAPPGRSTTPPAPQNPAYTGTSVQSGHVSTDYSGSYDEWFEDVVAQMCANYVMGIGQTSGYQDPSLGAPQESDFGSGANGGTGTISLATRRFFENYVRMYGATDPWITQRFGTPPQRSATYTPDPNSPGAINSANNDHDAQQAQADRDHDAQQRDKDRAIEQDRIAVQREGIQADRDIAVMDDVTRRWIAEGDWGVQKYIAEMQESGALERLKLELGMRDKELSQVAVAERNRHHESMVGLVLEVAQYDAELAAQPRNWLKYAVWLKNRGQVVDGLSLAMVATADQGQMDPGELANSGAPGAGVGAVQAVAEGGYNVADVDLSSTNYPEMLNQMLGSNGLGPESAPSLTELQAASSTLQTSNTGGSAASPMSAQQQVATSPQAAAATTAMTQAQESRPVNFGAYSGPTQNALGMTIQPSGHKEDFRRFRKLLPTQQQMRIGEIESIGRSADDFLMEMERSRPKGALSGAAGWG